MLRGCFSLFVMGVSTVIHASALAPFTLAKLVAGHGRIADWNRKVLAAIAESWIAVNNFVLDLQGIEWDRKLPGNIDHRGCYLVNCNHQSWVDILVLQHSFNRKLPFMRFFLKSELIWVPVLGIAWWALDFPFMKRASGEKLKKNPSLRGKDLENARKACEKFVVIPVAMMNFAEGTRFSMEKRDEAGAEYQLLLKPRIGGIGQVFYAFGERLDAMIDVTIAYPAGNGGRWSPSFWEMVSGQVDRIIVRAQAVPIPSQLLGRDFRSDRQFRKELEHWVHQQWQSKDAKLQELLQS